MYLQPNKAIVGENAFAHESGIHADGDNKNNLYYNDLFPERFGRVRDSALGKLSGKSNIRKNIEALGIELDEADMLKVTHRVIELGDKKEIITQDDLPYIISDVLKNNEKEFSRQRELFFVPKARGSSAVGAARDKGAILSRERMAL